MDLIKYDDFSKVDFRVGQIVEVIKVEGESMIPRIVRLFRVLVISTAKQVFPLTSWMD